MNDDAEWALVVRESGDANWEFYHLPFWHKWLKTKRYQTVLARKEKWHKREWEMICR